MKGEGESGDGSHARWCAIIEGAYRRMLGVALRLTRGNRARAEDIVHNAICKLLTGEHPLRIEQAASAYTYKAVVTAFLDEVRPFLVQSRNNDDTGGEGGEEGGGGKKGHRGRFVSYDDEQNGTLRKGLDDAQAVEELQRPLADEEYQRLFRIAAGPLSKREQVLFDMYYFERLSRREIADELRENFDEVNYEITALKSKVRGRVIGYGRSLARRKK